MTNTHENMAERMKASYAGESDQRRAAVQLLAEHGRWLRHPTFISAAVVDPNADVPRIAWGRARKAFDAGEFKGSTSEMAVLDLAIDLGDDRFRFGSMGYAHRDFILAALSTALGKDDAR